MTFLTLVLIAVIILAIIGLGWNTFVVAVLDGFDRTLDVGIPLIKNLTQEAQGSSSSLDDSDSSSDADSESESGFDLDSGSGTITPLNETTSLYENKEHGFSFMFPSAVFKEGDLAGIQSPWGRTIGYLNGAVQLESVNAESGELYPTFDVVVHDISSSSGYLDPQTMEVKNYTIEQYALDDVQTLEGLPPAGSIAAAVYDYTVTKNQPQGDAWRIEYITNIGNLQTSFSILILVVNEQTGKLYELEYTSDPLQAPKQIPIANKIIESFKFLE